jgi:leucyl aminopeptidase
MIPTSTDVKVTASDKLGRGGAVVILADEKGRLLVRSSLLTPAQRRAAEALLKDRTLTGKAGESGSDVVEGRRLIVLGVGKAEIEKVREAGAIAAKQAKRFKQKEIALVCPPDDADAAEALVIGFLLGAFEYREYRGAAAKQKEADALGRVALTIVGGAKPAVMRGAAIALGQNYARTIASRPGNDINPPSLAREAQRLARETGMTCRVIDDAEARRLGMGGLVGVGQGSEQPPRMITLEYNLRGAPRRGRGQSRARRSAAPLLIIGKSITFDTGGISIKPALGMGNMIYDKSGGMAVLGLMAAAARLGIDRPIVGLLAAAENMPGPNAYRPGDILRMHGGVTVEVTNTDAEGRLVLADALAWGIKKYQPSACIDLATLTGACVVALGRSRAGAWCNNEDLWQSLSAAAARAGEKLWRMPLGDDYREMLKATSADIVNSPGRDGGSNTAAEFLHHFIPGNLDGRGEVPWCHLDIAGVADTDKETALYARGSTGFGVRTLVEWISAM